MMMKQPTLETERLLLRPFQPADAADVQRLAGEFEIADTTLNMPHPYPDGAAEQWIAAHPQGYVEGTAITFAVVLRETGELCGAIGIHPSAGHAHAELGYWIGRPYWGRGYATEAARAIVDYGFATLGLHRIYARHFGRNPASGRVMQKLGMTHEGCQREHLRRWERFEDLVLYGILRQDWERRP